MRIGKHKPELYAKSIDAGKNITQIPSLSDIFNDEKMEKKD